MTPAAHLDDETLSAVLDGEPTADDAAARAHLADCAECRTRLAAFTDVAAAVGAPVDVSAAAADARDALIARALDAGVATDGSTRRSWAPVLAVAAVLVALLLAVPLFGSMTSDDDADMASGGRDDTATLESAAGSLADGALVDLGAIDRETVDDAVAAGLGEQVTTMEAPAPLAGPAEDSGEPAAGGAAAGGAADATAGDAPPDASRAADADTFSPEAARACASKLDVDGEPVLVGRATWDGETAAVLAYRVGEDIRAYVVDPADCSILHFVRFRARS